MLVKSHTLKVVTCVTHSIDSSYVVCIDRVDPNIASIKNIEDFDHLKSLAEGIVSALFGFFSGSRNAYRKVSNRTPGQIGSNMGQL